MNTIHAAQAGRVVVTIAALTRRRLISASPSTSSRGSTKMLRQHFLRCGLSVKLYKHHRAESLDWQFVYFDIASRQFMAA